MNTLLSVVLCVVVMVFSQSCSKVEFDSSLSSTTGLNCTGAQCPNGTYSWFEGGFNLCSKPCGGGNQTQTVECRRNADQVPVPDSFCDSATSPVSARTCNVQVCSTVYNWNAGAYGNCSLTCGGGERSRTVVCQDQTGTTVNDNNCAPPKPGNRETCNTNTCPPVSYTWDIKRGVCSKECGGGTVTDTVLCKRSDGMTVEDSLCPQPKPSTTYACNTQSCPMKYTYMWEPGAWTACSRECGPGMQTRTVVCKRNDGVYVDVMYCMEAPKPATVQNCEKKTCNGGHKVEQHAYVTPAQNAVDVVLIVDDSGSMKEDQAKLASRMAGMLTDLDSLNIDYQVCYTTTDIDYYKGSPLKWADLNSYIMKKNSPNKNQVFLKSIDALGSGWSGDEQGIKAMNLMVRDFKAAGCIRNDATLAVVLISDENERSVGGNASWSNTQYKPLTPENYPDSLINLVKSNWPAKKFLWNSIIVKPGDKACEDKQDLEGQSPSYPGTLYAELSNKTGGIIASICEADYAQSLKYIKDRAVNSMPGLTMECTPLDVPVITLDQQINTTITITGNQIKFSPAVNEGVGITATYTCP